MSCADTDWRERAACSGANTDLFFSQGIGQRAAIETFCNKCAVQAHCLDEHLLEEYGVFGGLTARERGDRRVSLGPPRKAPIQD